MLSENETKSQEEKKEENMNSGDGGEEEYEMRNSVKLVPQNR